MKKKNDLSFIGNNISKSFKLKTKHKKAKRRSLTTAQRLFLWNSVKAHKCNICSRRIYDFMDAELDHQMPVSKGGKAIFWAHRTCNRIKSSKSLKRLKKELRL